MSIIGGHPVTTVGAPVLSGSYATLPAAGMGYPGLGSYQPPVDPAQVEQLNSVQANAVREQANIRKAQLQDEYQRQITMIDQQAQHQLFLVQSQIETQKRNAHAQLKQQVDQQTWALDRETQTTTVNLKQQELQVTSQAQQWEIQRSMHPYGGYG